MPYDPQDTIVARATALGGAARGMVRISGPQVSSCLAPCFFPASPAQRLSQCTQPQVVPGTLGLTNLTRVLPVDLFLWPTQRSYTRQPTAELHTLGSPPLLEAVVQEMCTHGARLAEPGEFTLRAFLAGRLDLTQAEAVLGIIDARGSGQLQTALAQLAGGLSQPLTQLREQLLSLLAELEAGLDFVEEDIEFVTADQLCAALREARQVVAALLAQMTSRGGSRCMPRVVLVGPPNAGKSSLFNAMLEMCGCTAARAIVSEQAGTTRDYLTAVVDFAGTLAELVDTAGEDWASPTTIAGEAQQMTQRQREAADVIVCCTEITAACSQQRASIADAIRVLTKSDLTTNTTTANDLGIPVSSLHKSGLSALQHAIGQRLAEMPDATGSVVASTAARTRQSLELAAASLGRAVDLSRQHGVEELLAAEVRLALAALGQVVGAVSTDDILDRIFGQFCIGK